MLFSLYREMDGFSYWKINLLKKKQFFVIFAEVLTFSGCKNSMEVLSLI